MNTYTVPVVRVPAVYLCCDENAAVYSRFCMEEGCLPLAPGLIFPSFLDMDTEEDADSADFLCDALMALCDEVWVFQPAKLPASAFRKGKRIRLFTSGMQEVGT